MRSENDRDRPETDAHGHVVTRREFLCDSAKAAAGALTVQGIGEVVADTSAPREGARVVVVHHPRAILQGYQADSGVLWKMLEVGMKTLTGRTSTKQAWQDVSQTGQRVTMKWNELGGRQIWTHPELRNLVEAGLTQYAGLEGDRIRQFSRHEARGDEAQTTEVPIPYRGEPAKLRRLFTDFTDCLINMPVLKVHRSMGISAALKNHYGSITNPSRFHYWPQGMGKSIVELNLCPAIRHKTKLVICDALRPQWDQGPMPAPGRRWNENALLFGFDPLAVDAVGLNIIEEKRRTIDRFQRRSRWQLLYARDMLAYGEKKGLGIGDIQRIEVERIDMKA